MGKPKHPKVYSKNQIKKIKESGRLVAEVLSLVSTQCVEGVSTLDLDTIVYSFLKHRKAKSASYGYKNYPAHSCISIDEVILHGIPSPDKIIESGMIADGAVNIEVGEVDREKKRLNEAAKKCLFSTLDIIGPGVTVGEICKHQEMYTQKEGYKVIKEFRGHGVGSQLHEPPFIPYRYDENNPYNDYKLKPGNIIAIEPTLVTNDELVKLPDNWGYVTSDMSFGTSWEHTVLVTDNGMEIITKTDF